MLATLDNPNKAEAPKVRKTKESKNEARCKEFGKRLSAAIVAANMTQADLGRALNVSRSAVNWWANGNTYPSMDNIEAIAELLNTTPEWLLFGLHSVSSKYANIHIPVENSEGFITLPRVFLHMTDQQAEHLTGMPVKDSEGKSLAIINVGDVKIGDAPRMMAIKDPYGAGAQVVKAFKSPNKTDAIVIEGDNKSTETVYRPSMFLGSIAAMVDVSI